MNSLIESKISPVVNKTAHPSSTEILQRLWEEADRAANAKALTPPQPTPGEKVKVRYAYD